MYVVLNIIIVLFVVGGACGCVKLLMLYLDCGRISIVVPTTALVAWVITAVLAFSHWGFSLSH